MPRKSRKLDYKQCQQVGYAMEAKADYAWMKKGERWTVLHSDVAGRGCAQARHFYLLGPAGRVLTRGLPFTFLTKRFHQPLEDHEPAAN